ncbi:hypothetical protein VOLCADRAFT_94625, partial [Volvox carteri f. nagariensis]
LNFLRGVSKGDDAADRNSQHPYGQHQAAKFDLPLAVVLAGASFEAYLQPQETGMAFQQRNIKGPTVTFTDKAFLTETYTGVLIVQLMSATNLRAADVTGSSDPYAVLSLGESSFRSSTISTSLNPQWDEQYCMYIKDPASEVLRVRLYDEDIGKSDDDLGVAMVGLAELVDSKGVSKTFTLPLRGTGAGSGASVTLRCQLLSFADADPDQVTALTSTVTTAPSPSAMAGLQVAVGFWCSGRVAASAAISSLSGQLVTAVKEVVAPAAPAEEGEDAANPTDEVDDRDGGNTAADDSSSSSSASGGDSAPIVTLPSGEEVPNPWRVLAAMVGRAMGAESLNPVAFVENEETDTQAGPFWRVWLYRNVEAREAVVAFRGTEQVKWKDIATDLNLTPCSLNPERLDDNEGLPFTARIIKAVSGVYQQQVSGRGGGVGVVRFMVHKGFLSAYDSVRRTVFTLLDEITGAGDKGDNWRVLVTGHSLGGALATLAAYELAERRPLPPPRPPITLTPARSVQNITLYTFGAPRVGNKAFAEEFDRLVPDAWRVTNSNDIIPSVPRLMGYCHVGHAVRLDSEGQLRIGRSSAESTDVFGEGKAGMEVIQEIVSKVSEQPDMRQPQQRQQQPQAQPQAQGMRRRLVGVINTFGRAKLAPGKWLLDTGAEDHLTFTPEDVEDLTPEEAGSGASDFSIHVRMLVRTADFFLFSAGGEGGRREEQVPVVEGLPCLAARGRLPDFTPGLRSVLLALQDTTAPAGFLAKLPRLGLQQLPDLSSLTLALVNDHQLPSSSLADLAAAVPPSVTRLVLTHMLGGGGGRATTDGAPPLAGTSTAAVAFRQQLDYGALRHLLLLCPQVREVRLEGGCWVRSGADLQALAALTSPRPADGGSSGAGCGGVSGGGGGVVISSIRGMYLDTADGCLKLPMVLGSLWGLVGLDVQLVATAVRQAPVAAADADADAGGVGGLLADAAAALNLAHLGLASEQLLRGLAMPALAGLTRLVVREFQGSATALLGALAGLPLLAHLGLSGMDDAPYIIDVHLELLACLPSLRHLSVDRLDIAQQRGPRHALQPPPQLQQQQQHHHHHQLSGPYGAIRGSEAYPAWGPAGGAGAGGGSSSSSGASSAILPGLTGLDVALVVHSVTRLPHAFPSVKDLTLRWLWEQTMRKLAGWTSLTRLSLANLDCCLDWGLMRTLTGLTELQLCRGSSYEQLAELLYLLRAIPGLQVLRLSNWHSMNFSGPDRMAVGLTRGRGAVAAGGAAAGADGRGEGTSGGPLTGPSCSSSGEVGAGGGADAGGAMEGWCGGGEGSRAAAEPHRGYGQGEANTALAIATASALEGDQQQQQQQASTSTSSVPFSHCTSRSPPVTSTTTVAAAAAGSGSGGGLGGGGSVSAAVAAAFAAMDPDLYRAWGRIRAAADATAAASAAMALLRALPRLRILELSDCGYPLLRCFSSRALLEDGGPLTGLRELQLSQLMDVVGSDVEEAVAALPGLRRLAVRGCWPVDGEALLQLETLRSAGVDVTWRR